MANSDTITLTSRCLCKANVFQTQVPKTNLPLKASACHCSSCRHNSGALYTIDTPWPEPGSQIDQSNLKIFRFSSKVWVLFCGTCGTQMFFCTAEKPHEELEVLLGTLENVEGDLIKIEKHIFVGDTVDGGASVWLRKPNVDGSEAKRFKTRDDGEEIPFDWPASSSLTGHAKHQEGDTLPIRCKCGGIDYVLHRADYSGTKKEDLPDYVDPATHKIEACNCACDSCRLFSGIDFFPWTFTDLANITTSAGKPLPPTNSALRDAVDAKDDTLGTLAYYASSPPVLRFFCSHCGAKVFFSKDTRPPIVDIAVGLLDAKDGARAEGFLSWNYENIDFGEDMKGGWREAILNKIEAESNAWRIERGYPKMWRNA